MKGNRKQVLRGLQKVAASPDKVRGWIGPRCRLAEQNGEILGLLSARVRVGEGLAVIPADERYLRIDEHFVVPEQRDMGPGGRLLDRVIAEAAEQGVHRGPVYSAAGQWQRIISFYERHSCKMWCVKPRR